MTDGMSRPVEMPETAWASVCHRRVPLGRTAQSVWRRLGAWRPLGVWRRSVWKLATATGISVGVLLPMAGCGKPTGAGYNKPSSVNSQAGFSKELPVCPADLPYAPAGLQTPLLHVLPDPHAVPGLASWSMEEPKLRLVGSITGDPWAAMGSHGLNSLSQAAKSSVAPETWQSDDGPLLRRLPPVETVPGVEVAGPFGLVSDLPPVVLLPPQPIASWEPSLNELGQEPAQPEQTDSSAWGESARPQPEVPESIPATPEDALETSWNNLSDAEAALYTGVLTGEKNHDIALAKIQQGYLLADRHAYYAARQEFIQVLRMVSRTADAREGTTVRTTDLASGLRALEEAEDFVPHGTGLEADLNVSIIISAHRTTVVQDGRLHKLQPRQLMDRYFRYAQLKLAAAVEGDPDGSMALHALGKLQRRLSQLEPKDNPLAHRQAFAYQQAALLAHHYNHLAAHELGVLLADAGHYTEAVSLLEQVAAKEPHPVVLRNLAQVQYQLGYAGRAAANDRQADQLAAQPGVAGSNVQWVSPREFAGAADATTFGLPVQPPVQTLTDPVRANTTPARVADSQSHPSHLRGAR